MLYPPIGGLGAIRVSMVEAQPSAAETLRGRGIGLAEFLEQFRLLRQRRQEKFASL